jgi:H+/Cl- antiporter ClcA
VAWKVSHKTLCVSAYLYNLLLRYRYAPYTDRTMNSINKHTKNKIHYYWLSLKLGIFFGVIGFLLAVLILTEVNKETRRVIV